MITVYLAGPIATGDQFANTGRALQWADKLKQKGFCVFVPHWGALQQMYSPWAYDEWLEYDYVWLDKCEVLFRLSGISNGSDKEVARAKARGMSIFYEDADGLRLLEQYRKVKNCELPAHL